MATDLTHSWPLHASGSLQGQLRDGEGDMVPVHLGNSNLGLGSGLRRVRFLGLWQKKKKKSQISDVDSREAHFSLAREIKSEGRLMKGTKGLEGELFGSAQLSSEASSKLL